MRYQQAVIADIPQIVEKRIAYLHEYHQGLAPHYVDDLLPKLNQYFQKHLNKNIHAYLATDECSQVRAIALLLVTEKPARPSFINGRTGLVLNVYTDPAFRKQGHAEKLMQLLIQDAYKFDLDYIELTATKDGYPLYQKLGFHDFIPETKPMKLHLKKDL